MVLVDEDEREKAVAAGGRTVCLNVPQEGIAKAVAQIESKMVTIAKFLCRVSWTKRLRSLTSGGGPGSHSGHSSPMVTVAFVRATLLADSAHLYHGGSEKDLKRRRRAKRKMKEMPAG